MKLFKPVVIIIIFLLGMGQLVNADQASQQTKIYEVTDVQLSILKSDPPMLSITAAGNVTTGGWTNPVLIPYVYIVPPEDGMYEFDFSANRPTGIVIQAISPIAASTIMEEIPKELKGVRIHASVNAKEVAIK